MKISALDGKDKGRKHPMEILWICFAVLCLFVGISRTINHGFDDAWPMYLFTALCVLFFCWRRSLRKKEEDDGKKMQ